MSTETIPAVYEADVDEMTAGGLAVLGELRRRFVDVGTAASVLRVVDAYAAEMVLDATEDADDDAGTRLCLVPDFGPEHLRTALYSVEEFLGTLAQWERDPEMDGWTAPAALRGEVVEAAIQRIREAVQLAETHTSIEAGERVEVPPAGPSWDTTRGHQLAALTFVALPVNDLAVLAAVAAELAHPDSTLRDADEATCEYLDLRQPERDGPIGSAARLRALFSLEPDADTTILRQAALTARGGTVVLDRAQEDVWHRAVNRCYAAFRPDDVLGRWVMGNRDHD